MGRTDRGAGRPARARLRSLSGFPAAALVLAGALAAARPAPADAQGGAAAGRTLRVSLSVTDQAAGSVSAPAALLDGLERLFDAQLGSLVTLDTSGSPGAAAGPAARVRIDLSGRAVSVSTDFSPTGDFGRGVRSLVSTVPSGSPASLLATISGDLAFLEFSFRGFSTLSLAPPPVLVASLPTDALSALTGWNAQELEPLGLAGHGDEITVCFPHRYLTLGPLFEVTEDTVRDINAQFAAREPLQLSGAAAGSGPRLVLMSQSGQAIVTVDPRLGTRAAVPAPGLSALPARLLDPGTVVGLPAESGAPGLVTFALDGSRAPVVIPVSASYLSALDKDREGNLWTWDAAERRIRIVTAGGREVYSIRPLVSASEMPLPQQLVVLDDGSFLLAGSAEVWKFQASGIPVWRLTRIPGRPGESLPPTFDLAADRGGGTFTILDQPSRRLLTFSASPTPEQAPLAALLSRLDARKSGDLSQASSLARAQGLGLAAYGFAATGASFGAERAAARRALLEEKASAYSALAASLEQDLLLERADRAYQRAAESLRELSAEDPSDTDASSRLAALLAVRRAIRAEILTPSLLVVERATLVEARGSGCGLTTVLHLFIRNSSPGALDAVRIHAGVPSLGLAPALAAVGTMPAADQREVELPLGTPADAAGGMFAPTPPAFVLVNYEQAGTGATAAVSLPAVRERPAEDSPARQLACRAVAEDTLAASLPDSLLAGPRPAAPSPLAELGSVLDSLGRARASAAAAESQSTGAPPALARPMRASLRSLSRDEAEWTVVTASAAAALGLPAAILWRSERPLALVDTQVPLTDAVDGLPGLRPFQRALGELSPDGMLWVPLSGRPPPAASRPVVWAVVDGLAAAAGRAAAGDDNNRDRVDLASTAAGSNAPVPFPLVVPALAARATVDDLASAVGAALNDQPTTAPDTPK